LRSAVAGFLFLDTLSISVVDPEPDPQGAETFFPDPELKVMDPDPAPYPELAFDNYDTKKCTNLTFCE
jgi:hypothetical protein